MSTPFAPVNINRENSTKIPNLPEKSKSTPTRKDLGHGYIYEIRRMLSTYISFNGLSTHAAKVSTFIRNPIVQSKSDQTHKPEKENPGSTSLETPHRSQFPMLKRLRDPTEISECRLHKRINGNSNRSNILGANQQPKEPTLSCAGSVMQACAQSDRDNLLIGDCSKRFALPLVENGKLSDLKQISGFTLSALINGKYRNSVDRYEIIDCRYPYEYEGGHIKGSLNLHTQQQIHDKYFKSKPPIESNPKKRVILIFHCEFSIHRGPEMCRFLRGADRKCNSDTYPALHYPELYVLTGGFKNIFENHNELCDPVGYIPMDDPRQADNLKLYRNQSKFGLIKSISSKQMKVSNYSGMR